MPWLQNFINPFESPVFLLILLVLLTWSLVWKGLALWKAARAGSAKWFIVLLVVNTLGILEILYLYVFSGKSEPKNQQGL